jgi:hypothetical protein
VRAAGAGGPANGGRGTEEPESERKAKGLAGARAEKFSSTWRDATAPLPLQTPGKDAR